MQIYSNFIKLTPNIRQLLYFSNLSDPPGDFNYCLNYYEFHLLVHFTRSDNNLFSKFDDAFFNQLSTHKDKLSLCGLLNLKKNTFVPTELIYQLDDGELGLYVRKNILSSFNEHGIELTLKYKGIDKKAKPKKAVFKFG
jgi:hypothetical protein